MAEPTIADQAQGALEEAERSDPEAHGYTDEVKAALAELLRASAEHIEAQARADSARDRVVVLARAITENWRLTDAQAIREAGALATRAVRLGVLRGATS